MNETGIDWCDMTWNPVTGCTKCSPGCKNCYAERMAQRLAGRCGYPAVNPFDVTLHYDRLDDPPRTKTPKIIFVNSMSDTWHGKVSFKFVDEIFKTAIKTPWHKFLFLTKRPERARLYFDRLRIMGTKLPIPNVWVGATIESQKEAEARIPHLLAINAAGLFVSVEPMLGGVYLTHVNIDDGGHYNALTGEWSLNDDGIGKHLDWVICGGETGPVSKRRSPKTEWVGHLLLQCKMTGTPFWFKQWGDKKGNENELIAGRFWKQTPFVDYTETRKTTKGIL